jgi:hypothetical protein
LGRFFIILTNIVPKKKRNEEKSSQDDSMGFCNAKHTVEEIENKFKISLIKLSTKICFFFAFFISFVAFTNELKNYTICKD